MNSEIECYGIALADLRESVEKSLTFKHQGFEGVAASLMSDAQEAMLMGDTEWARQLINQATWVIFTYRERN